MIKILFICHGNICRSPAAEMVARQLVKGMDDQFQIASAATTYEEIGNDIYPPMRRTLQKRGIPMIPHKARRTTRDDYAKYDYIIGMDEENRYDLLAIYGGDPDGKISSLLDWTGENREVSDPWYTRNFDKALDDIERGCGALIAQLISEE